MGETFLLLSCGAAFITGIVIAAASHLGHEREMEHSMTKLLRSPGLAK